MFSRKVPSTVFNAKPNLKPSCNASIIKPFFSRYNFTVNEMKITDMFKNIRDAKIKMRTVIENVRILQSLRNSILTIPRNLKQQSAGVLRVWAHQAECVVAQRLRRSQQMFSLYTKLWEERALKALVANMRHHITKRGKEFVCSAIGLAAYNWDDNRISPTDLEKHINELDYIRLLTEKTMLCEMCKSEMRKSTPPNLNLCHCGAKQPQLGAYENWVPFIEKEDMLVWRKIVDAGQYEYKVYGSYNDVTAEDFLNVQIDSDYRKKWDTTAVRLEVVEKDPVPRTNSDVIYWEMQWPRFFSNRDYVFNRRFVVDWDKKTIVIISRGTNHPACPLKQDKFRVQDYWSYMVIKPYTDIDKPGIEFGLTYFDNPGVNIPSTVTSWVAMRAMPDFLARLRIATKEYKTYCQTTGSSCIFNLQLEREAREIQPDEEEEVITDNTIYDPVPKFPTKPSLPLEICNEQSSNDLPLSSNLPKVELPENNPNVPSEVSNKLGNLVTSPNAIGFEVKRSSASTQSESESRSNIEYWKPNFS